MTATWSLLAPGPSLAALTAESVLPAGPVVALNGAILAPVRADFWCCQDGPRVWAEIAPRFAPGIVWCKDTQAAAWSAHGLRPWAHPHQEPEFREAFVWKDPQIAYTNLTITTALARMVHYGARRIALFGVDMGGTSYFAGEDRRGRTPPVWQARWDEERRLLKIALDGWNRSEGLEVEFRTTVDLEGKVSMVAQP